MKKESYNLIEALNESNNSKRKEQINKLKEEVEAEKGALCDICNEHMLEVDGCVPLNIVCDETSYDRVKCGDSGDFFEGKDENTRCSDCGAKVGHYHHLGCDCERCPVCGRQLISCDCDLKFFNK